MGTKAKTVTIDEPVHKKLVAEKKRTGIAIYRLIADAFELYLSATPEERAARKVTQRKAG
ncbi:MAG: hypothetical protein H6819_06805 [Phycisphaerales bacterium]|nr:hypothetical protein [Phycisphaerales bacterium]MCB9855291.1 hypothetical protein [Phycisphaerales bacterium]MCB9862884.1 hypothetical protein [Phycisphaerales bacterium]